MKLECYITQSLKAFCNSMRCSLGGGLIFPSPEHFFSSAWTSWESEYPTTCTKTLVSCGAVLLLVERGNYYWNTRFSVICMIFAKDNLAIYNEYISYPCWCDLIVMLKQKWVESVRQWTRSEPSENYLVIEI